MKNHVPFTVTLPAINLLLINRLIHFVKTFYVLALFCLCAFQQQAFAQRKASITGIEVFSAQSVFSGCDNSRKVITFTAYVTANGPSDATYKWRRSDGAASGSFQNLHFDSAGTKKITTTWTLSLPAYEGWEEVAFETPNVITSNRASFSIYCCKNEDANCKNNPFTINSCALNLVHSFKNLVTGTGTRICNATVGSINVSSAMNLNCYSNSGNVPGFVTYTSFYHPADTVLRVIWGSAANDTLAYHYYGACAPNPLVFPSAAENHVFDAFLVPVADYQASPLQLGQYSENYAEVRKLAIKPADIADFTGWYYESATGYMAITNPLSYNSTLSSKGLVVKVKLASNAVVACYLFNNYDNAGTIIWKDASTCADQGTITSVPKRTGVVNDAETVLFQNAPNPFTTETEIRVVLETNVSVASINLYSTDGVLVRSIPVNARGITSLKLSASDLRPGFYVYSLVADGKVLATKNLVVTK